MPLHARSWARCCWSWVHRPTAPPPPVPCGPGGCSPGYCPHHVLLPLGQSGSLLGPGHTLGGHDEDGEWRGSCSPPVQVPEGWHRCASPRGDGFIARSPASVRGRRWPAENKTSAWADGQTDRHPCWAACCELWPPQALPPCGLPALPFRVNTHTPGYGAGCWLHWGAPHSPGAAGRPPSLPAQCRKPPHLPWASGEASGRAGTPGSGRCPASGCGPGPSSPTLPATHWGTSQASGSALSGSAPAQGGGGPLGRARPLVTLAS